MLQTHCQHSISPPVELAWPGPRSTWATLSRAGLLRLTATALSSARSVPRSWSPKTSSKSGPSLFWQSLSCGLWRDLLLMPDCHTQNERLMHKRCFGSIQHALVLCGPACWKLMVTACVQILTPANEDSNRLQCLALSFQQQQQTDAADIPQRHLDIKPVLCSMYLTMLHAHL